jgi:hypothetical protein
MTPDSLTKLADEMAAHLGLSAATVSTYVFSDGKRVDQFRKGRTCTVRVAERAIAWFSQNWPADLAWPSDIPRPALIAGAASDAPANSTRKTKRAA